MGGVSIDRTVLVAVVLIFAGLGLIAVRLLGLSAYAWPVFVIAPGLALCGAAVMVGGRQGRAFAASGAVVVATGLILFAQAVTGYYRSWAYAWPLLVAAAGAGLAVAGGSEGDRAAELRGRTLVQWGLVAFVVLAAVFEALIFDGGIVDAGIVLPLVLILVGGYLLVTRIGHRAAPPQGHAGTAAGDGPAPAGGPGEAGGHAPGH